MVTFWVALTPVHGEADAPLLFAGSSHKDFALPCAPARPGGAQPL